MMHQAAWSVRGVDGGSPLRTSHAKYVGRVGALALFLGVGAAIAMPTAEADTGGSAHSSGAGSSSHAASAKKSGGAAASQRAQAGSARVTATSAPATVTGQPRAVASSHRVRATDPAAPVASPTDLAAVAYTRRRSAPLQQGAAGTTMVELTNQASPLGTQQQVSREQLAMQAVRTLPVALMKFVLRQGFLAAANRQFALVGGPDAANLDALNNAVDEYALASAFSEQILNPMNPAVVTQVAPPHSWYGMDVAGSRLLYDNPDTIYRFIPVNKTSEYVITGRFYDAIPADTTFSVLEGSSGKTSTILSLKDIDVSDDGSFVITVSGAPATPGEKNHLQLTSSSTLVAVRNTLGDWNTEEPMDLAVHKVGGPPNSLFAQLGGFLFFGAVVNNNPTLAKLVSLVPPLPIADTPIVHGTLTALLMVIRGANQEAKYMALATTDPATGMPRQPNTMTEPASNAEFLANQLQSNGYFQLADDEALVLTIDPGNAKFVSIPVYNDWTITDDYWNEPTSLNSDQAVQNDDGTYTVVISPTDPLVANWISTGGLNQGIISMRFQNLDTEDPAQPSVQSQVVKLDELTHNTNGTAVITQAERDQQLALRKAGFDKRWAPYPQA